MEYITFNGNSTTLWEYVDQGFIHSALDASKLLLQIIHQLEALKQAGYSHNDIKDLVSF